MRLRWQRFQAPCKLISLKQRHCSVCWDLWPRGRLGDTRCRSRGQHGQWVKAKTLLGEFPRKQGRQTQGIPLEWWIYFAFIFALQKSRGMMFYSNFFLFLINWRHFFFPSPFGWTQIWSGQSLLKLPQRLPLVHLKITQLTEKTISITHLKKKKVFIFY